MKNFLQRSLLALSSVISKYLSMIHMPYSRKMVTGKDYYSLQAIVKPGMVICTKTNGEVANMFIPGFWGHVAIVSLDTKYVIEATTHGVVKTDLVSFMIGKDCVGAFKSLFTSSAQDEDAAKVAEKQLGKLYDFEFTTSDIVKFYCSELVWYSYEEAVGEVPFKPREILGQESILPSDFELATDKFKAVWYSESNEVLR